MFLLTWSILVDCPNYFLFAHPLLIAYVSKGHIPFESLSKRFQSLCCQAGKMPLSYTLPDLFQANRVQSVCAWAALIGLTAQSLAFAHMYDIQLSDRASSLGSSLAVEGNST